MAPSVGFTGRGGKISISIDGGSNYTQIKQVKKVNWPGAKANFDDITNLDSESAHVESIPTTLDAGTVSLDIISKQDDAGQLLLSASFEAQTKLKVKVEYPAQSAAFSTGLVRTFDGYVSQDGKAGLDVGAASQYTSELKITGAVSDASPVPAAAPTVSAVSPSAGSTAGGTDVVITGTNFVGVTAVMFGSSPATTFDVISATKIYAVSPAESAATADVKVTNAAGTSATSSADHFVYS